MRFLLANLHGEPDVLRALAKLVVLREVLMRELEGLEAEEAEAKEKGPLLKPILKIYADLEAIAKDGPVVEKHCTATPDEIEAAIQAYRQEFNGAANTAVGAMFCVWKHKEGLKEAEVKFRRMRT